MTRQMAIRRAPVQAETERVAEACGDTSYSRSAWPRVCAAYAPVACDRFAYGQSLPTSTAHMHHGTPCLCLPTGALSPGDRTTPPARVRNCMGTGLRPLCSASRGRVGERRVQGRSV